MYILICICVYIYPVYIPHMPHLAVAPALERRLVQAGPLYRVGGNPPVGISDQAQLREVLVPRFVVLRHCRAALRPAWMGGGEIFIGNLLVRIHSIIVMIRWTGLAPWEFEFLFPGSLTSTLLVDGGKALDQGGSTRAGPKQL